jgi:hypothetical protein
MKITVLIKNVFGEDKAYPHCDMANKFAKLLGTKTLTKDALKQIKDMGYEIEAKFPSDFLN